MNSAAVSRLCRTHPNEIGLYYDDVRRAGPLLTLADEQALARRVRCGDRAAVDALVTANLRLVIRIAFGYRGRGLSYEDLIQEGNCGLMRAVRDFDPDRNIRFSTYASYWIKAALRGALGDKSRPIRLPRYTCDLMLRWRRIFAELHNRLGRRPEDVEVAREMGITRRTMTLVVHALDVSERMRDARHLGEVDVCCREPDPIAAWVEAEEIADMLAAVDARIEESLNPVEALVIRGRYPTAGHPVQRLRDLADELHLSHERIRQIEREALGKLVNHFAGAPLPRSGGRSSPPDRDEPEKEEKPHR